MLMNILKKKFRDRDGNRINNEVSLFWDKSKNMIRQSLSEMTNITDNTNIASMRVIQNLQKGMSDTGASTGIPGMPIHEVSKTSRFTYNNANAFDEGIGIDYEKYIESYRHITTKNLQKTSSTSLNHAQKYDQERLNQHSAQFFDSS